MKKIEILIYLWTIRNIQEVQGNLQQNKDTDNSWRWCMYLFHFRDSLISK